MLYIEVAWYRRTAWEARMQINEAYLVQIEGWRGAVRQPQPAAGVQTATAKAPFRIWPAIEAQVKILKATGRVRSAA